MGRKQRWMHMNRWALLVLVLGSLSSGLVAWALTSINEYEARTALQQQVEVATQDLLDQLEDYQYGLVGIRGLMLAAQERDIDPRALRRYLSAIRYEGLNAGLLDNIGYAHLQRSEASDGQALSDRLVSDYRYSIRLSKSIGQDGDLQRSDLLAAAQRAARSGRNTLAWLQAPLPGDAADKLLAMLLPVYSSGSTPSSVDLREETAQGIAFTTFSPRQLGNDLNRELINQGVWLRSLAGFGEQPLIFQGDAPVAMTSELKLALLGQQWTLEFAASPSFVDAQQGVSPRQILLAGLTLSGLLAWMLGVLALNAHRRRQINAERARLAEVVDSSTDGIISKDLNGIVTSWNRGAQEIFGYTSEQAIGRSVAELVVPRELSHEEVEILGLVGRGEGVSGLRTRRQHRDGHLLDVAVTVSPIRDGSGRVIGASKIVRDISPHVESERRIQDLNARLERQVTERTEQLSQLNALFGSVLDAASELSIIASDLNGVITIFNPGAERQLGYSAEEMVGKASPELIHDAEELRQRGEALRDDENLAGPLEGYQILAETAARGLVENREWTYVRKDGSRLPVTLMVTAMRDAQGKGSGYLSIAVDISERRAAERELAVSLETTRAILDTAVNPIITIDSRGTIRSCNPAGERALGYQAEELIGCNVKMLMPDPFSSEHDGYMARFRSTGAGRAIGIGREVEARRKDGSLFPVQISLGAMRVAGEPMVVGIMSDISEQRRQRDEVISARDQLALAADVAKIGIWTWEIGKDRLQWNERMYDIYGYAPANHELGLSSSAWAARLHPDDRERALAEVRALLQDGNMYATLFRIVLPGDQVRHIKAAGQVERGADGHALKITGINLDVTDEQELQASLRYAKEQADAASAAKSTFLANMSHEIRTPMNAVLGMLYLAQQTSLNPRQRDYVDKAHTAATSLLGLLNDILDYSKIEAGKLTLDPHTFELEPLFEELGIVLSGNQGRKRVELLFDIDSGLPAELQGDRLRLQQILINLAGNALKFTEHGQVVISVRQLARSDQQVKIRVSVSDTGIGISEEQMSRIFSGFTQAEASTSRRFGGSGLGLVISKRLIELMGGQLKVQSTLGIGSRFWFDITLPFAQSDDLRAGYPHSQRSLHVLIVDDNEVAGGMLVATTRALGWRPDYVQDGDSALRRVSESLAADDPYDVVLLDWRMPGLDGPETARRIAQQTAERGTPAMLMISAYGREQLESEGEDFAVDRFLSKPVTPRQVAEAVHELLGGGSSALQKAAEAPAIEQPLAGLRLLVVEDNAMNRQVAFELLTAEGASVQLAEDGEAGVNRVIAAKQTFDAVLMDMQMPVVDGLEATRRIRKDERFARLPIIAMTANASQADREACLQAGMNEHVAKPIERKQLITRLLECIHGLQNTQVSRRETAVPASDIADYATLLERFAGNHSLLEQMLGTFANDVRPRFAQIAQLLENNQRGDAAAALHSIKGSAGTIGALALFRFSAALERQLLDGPAEAAPALSPEELVQAQGLFEDNLERLRALLQANRPVTQTPTPSSTKATSSADLDGDLQRLIELLHANNLDALDLLETLQPQLQAHDAKLAEQLAGCAQALDFAQAAALAERLATEIGG